MKRTLILAAVAAALTAPVAASPLSEAIMHFNMDKDSVLETRTVPTGDNFVTVSSRNGSALNEALALFNASQDSVSDLRGLNGVTVYDNTPSNGADIFARIQAESAENE